MYFSGHSGHDVPDKQSYNINQHLFNLRGQVVHKYEFINNFIDNIHLIGHSIGAWMIIELLYSNPNLITRIKSINLLFPTVQHMAVTQNGKFLNKIIRKLHIVVMFFMYLLYLLPDCIHTLFIKLYLKYNSLPEHFLLRIKKLINPFVMEKVLLMSYDEMDSVVNLNVQCLDKIKHLINVIYSIRDGWAPISYMEDFKKFQPELTMEAVNINHAFVLKSSEIVAEKVANNINKK